MAYIHGMRNTRFYKIYDKAHSRCTNPHDKDYVKYGQRGIKFLWPDFVSFRDDMYESYLAHVEEYGEKDTTIDRIDFDGNYCKENCRWATIREQNLNKHFKNGNIPWKDGTAISVTRYCELHNISHKRLKFLSKKYKKSVLEILYEMHIDKEVPDPELMLGGRGDNLEPIYEYNGNRYILSDLMEVLKVDNKPLFKQRLSAMKGNLNAVLERWYNNGNT